MFFEGPNRLPDELILHIVKHLPLKEAVALLSTSQQMKAIIGLEESIWKKYGAATFEEFITRLQNLPEGFRPLILHERCSLDDAEAASQALRSGDLLSMVKGAILLVPAVERLFPSMENMELLQGEDDQLVQLIEGNIGNILQNIPADKRSEHLQGFLFANTLIAIADKLITLDQVLSLPTQNLIQFASNENALQALRDNWITVDQLSREDEDIDELINRGVEAHGSSPSPSSPT